MDLTSYELGYLVAAAGLGDLSEGEDEQAKEVKLMGLRLIVELEEISEEDREKALKGFLGLADKAFERVNKIKDKISKEEDVISE